MAQFKLLHYFDEEPIEPDFEMDFYVPIKINNVDILPHDAKSIELHSQLIHSPPAGCIFFQMP